MSRHAFAVVVLSALAGSAPAGEFNKILSPGDAAPKWEKLAAADGKAYALADFADKDVLVVAFTCVTCPVANDYDDRLVAFAKGAGEKVGVVAINSNAGPDDAPPKMAARAKKMNYPFPYLADPTGAVAKAYGVRFTPEFVVLDKARKVVYLGAFDDKNKADLAKTAFVADAVAAALAGKPAAKAETPGRGCLVKFAKAKADDR